ncbi:MAG: hypothetical protein QW478_13545, partial [Candidatus Micrarchaeaceae archaeon]
MTPFPGYPYFQAALLAIFLYAGYEDFQKRKIHTFPFLLINGALAIYYGITDTALLAFFIPVLGEYYNKRGANFLYLFAVLPVILTHFSLTAVIIMYSLLLIKAVQWVAGDFGSGDVKALETVVMAFPFYYHFPEVYSLFPPVLAVATVASILGVVATLADRRRRRRGRGEGRGEKYWERGGK